MTSSMKICQKCGVRTKTKFSLCKRCYWKEQNSRGPEGHFTYIIEYSGERYYIGHTRNINRAVYRHKHGDVPQTKGKNPRLMWARKAKDSQEAEEVRDSIREAENEHSSLFLMRWLALEGPLGRFRPGTKEYFDTQDGDLHAIADI